MYSLFYCSLFLFSLKFRDNTCSYSFWNKPPSPCICSTVCIGQNLCYMNSFLPNMLLSCIVVFRICSIYLFLRLCCLLTLQMNISVSSEMQTQLDRINVFQYFHDCPASPIITTISLCTLCPFIAASNVCKSVLINILCSMTQKYMQTGTPLRTELSSGRCYL